MTTFLDLAGDDSDVATAPPPAPAKKKTFAELAGPPEKPSKATKPDGTGFLQQPEATTEAVTADIKKNGLDPSKVTFNGKPLDPAAQPAAPQAGAGRGMVNPPMPAPGSASEWRLPGSGDRGPAVNATPHVETSLFDKLRAGGEATANTLASLTGRPQSPVSPLGQEYTQNVGDFLTRHGPSIVGIGPEIGAVGEMLSNRAQLARAQAGVGVRSAQEAFGANKSPPIRIEPTAEAAPIVSPVKFSDAAPPTSGPLPAAEQQRRAQVLSSVGLAQTRASAITGNAKAAATDAQLAKVDNPAGNAMRAQLDSEKAALANHADELVKGTGGTQGLDQSTLFSRGNTIVSPLDALKEHFDTQTSALYKVADARAQGVPAEMPATHSYIGGDQAEFLGTSEGEQLLKGVKARMKSLGMADAEGNPTAATVQQSEQLKQYLNNQWQPRTARLIRGMKDAIDEDVTKAAGDDIYQQARQMRAQRAATLDNPNGIAKVMDSSGPDGINRSVPIEKIPDAIAGMPVKQFGHIVETLKGVPDEIQPQAAAALGEIKAHFANKVQSIGGSQQGQWNAKGVTKFLNNNSERMAQVFTPEEMAQFRNLNDAGHILAKDQSYPGAAVQQHNLVKAGVVGGFTSAGGAAGGALAGPPGAAVGSWLGAKAGSAINDAASLRAAKARLMNLKDVGK